MPRPRLMKILVLGWLLVVAGWSGRAETVPGTWDWADPPTGVFFDEWAEVLWEGQKAGFGQTRLSRVEHRVYTLATLRLQVRRAGLPIDLDTRLETEETVAGEVVSFRFVLRLAGTPVEFRGQVAEGELRVSSGQLDHFRDHRYPWPAEARLTWGALRETLRQGLAPDTRYRLLLYSPETRLDAPVPVEVTVLGPEPIDWRGAPRPATRVRSVMRVAGAEVVSDSWVDAAGRTLRTLVEMGGLALEMRACSEAEALAAFLPAEVFQDTLLTLDRALPPNATSVTFAVALTGDEPPPVPWPETTAQTVTVAPGAPGHRAGTAHLPGTSPEETPPPAATEPRPWLRVQVRRVPPPEPPVPGGALNAAEADEPGPEYLEANAYLDHRDPVVRGLLEQALPAGGKAADPWAQADALRRFVTAFITEKNLSVGFATASEVAGQAEGDCTEHAVLLAALARAAGQPSRVAAGLVFLPRWLERENVMGFHLWTQVWVAGAWRDLDAAFGESVCSPIRLTLATSSLAHDSMADLALAVMQALGRLGVTVEDIQVDPK